MESKEAVMQEVFNELNERNKDIMILVARSVNIAQEDSERRHMGFPDKDKRADLYGCDNRREETDRTAGAELLPPSSLWERKIMRFVGKAP